MRTWVIDLDGVMWRGNLPIDGSAEAIARIRAGGDRVLFATNHSAPTRLDHLDALRRMGVGCDEEDLFTSADAAASLVRAGETAHVLADRGVREALTRRRVNITDGSKADVVIVGWHEAFTFARLTSAVRTVLGGARLVATNDDRLRPGPQGPVPGCGALVAYVEAATSTEAARAGKPYQPMADLLLPRLSGSTTVVGDSGATDGGLAVRLGARFAWVGSGVDKHAAAGRPEIVGSDLLDVVVQEQT